VAFFNYVNLLTLALMEQWRECWYTAYEAKCISEATKDDLLKLNNFVEGTLIWEHIDIWLLLSSVRAMSHRSKSDSKSLKEKTND